jgi:FixJ family two-component response regulator
MPDRTIYVVDDDDAVRNSLAALLESDGLATEVFASAQAFLDAYPAPPDGCLVVDVKMPGMSGLELQQRLAADGADLPVIVITGHGDIPMAVKALKSGAFDFIEKPFDDTAFLDSVRSALDQTARERSLRALAASASARIGRLTAREDDVMRQLVVGQPNKVIAHNLGISPRTVELHRARVMEKMRARSLSELVRMAIAIGL